VFIYHILVLIVIRPQLPMDMLQQSFGEAEDILVSLFECIRHQQQHPETNIVIVIIDDIEHILGTIHKNKEQATHFVQRCTSTFSVLMDSLYVDGNRNFNPVLFLCTTSYPEIATSMSCKFDYIHYLESPNEMERRDLIKSFLILKDESCHNAILMDLVEATVSKSYSEIVQLCRQGIEVIGATTNTTKTIKELQQQESDYHNINMNVDLVLHTMKERLQSNKPESLRGEYVDGFVDMRVFSSRDLQSIKQTKLNGTTPFHPSKCTTTAWNILQSTIIIPLCRSKELLELFDTSVSNNHKMIAGAVLLSGESGSGKSEIAMRCATYASELLPTIKLIDVSCTSLIHKEVGASEQAIQNLFDATRRAAPAILLMDGIETIAGVRGNDSTTEGTMDRILSTLLIELDGIDSNASSSLDIKGGIAIIGITHDETWIDPALKRPGRFDRVILMRRDW
jgi:SpoVK/Ycf46/Vps4 family AAA+-type ATPase